MCFHAPGYERDPDDCKTWWTKFKHTVERQRKCNSQLVLIGDANARIGQYESNAVGTCGAEAENEAGECFHDVIQSLELWLPATFEETLTGVEHTTWVTPSGVPSGRIDFIAIPQTWRRIHCRARTEPDIDLTFGRVDHVAISVCLKGCPPENQCVARRRKAVCDPRTIKNPDALKFFVKYLSSTKDQVDTPWTLDVHTHMQLCLRR